MQLEDDPWNLHVVGGDRIWGPPHRPSPYTCKVRAKDLVSVLDSGRSHGTVRYHAATYHSQEVAVSGMPQYSLCLASPSCFLHFTLGKTFHVSSYSLNKGERCFGLELLKVKVRHTFVIVLEDDVACISAQDKSATMASRVIYDMPQLLKLFQWQDGGHITFVEPYFLQGPYLST
jgi:hypothetical protein